MSVSFEYIRKKRILTAVINSIVTAASLFAILFGAFILTEKIWKIEVNPLLSLPISIGVGLIAGGITALVTLKSKKQIAREIDEAHSLDERIQTMIAFADDDGEIARLQREDTERQLSKLHDNRSFFKQFGASIISMVLAVAIILPAVLVPKATENEDDNTTPPAYVEPFELASWQSERLKKLIETVREASIDETFKTATVQELTRLLSVLEETDTKDEMISEVISSIVLIDAAAEVTASYKLIAVALFSAQPHINKENGEVLDSETYVQIKNIARYIIKLNAIDFGQDIKSVIEYFKADTVLSDEPETENPSTESKSTESKVITVTEKLLNFKSEIERVLNNEDIPENDAIKTNILSFAAKLGEYATLENEKERQSLLDIEFDKFSDNISTVLAAQYENKAIRDTVINTLMLLFEINKDMLPKLLGDTVPALIDGNEDSSGGNETGGATGGYGEGNELWGSNDTIYDPFGKDGAGHALYGDVFDDYYKKIVEILSDESLNEETRQAIAEYFKKLSDGTKN